MSESYTFSRAHTSAPLRVLLICSDDPQHSYLRHQFARAFPNLRCIVESNDGQIRHLRRKGNKGQLRWMKYHSLRRKWSGDSQARKAYFQALLPPDFHLPAPDLAVDTVNSKAAWEAVADWKPEITVVAGTKYIGPTLIRKAGLMLNLHTGYLPDYKGNHCIFFALYERQYDRVAATIHLVNEELDGGDVLEVVPVEGCSKMREEALYARCAHAVIDRCLEQVQVYASGGELEFHPQTPCNKPMFRHRDRTPWKELRFWWRRRF